MNLALPEIGHRSSVIGHRSSVIGLFAIASLFGGIAQAQTSGGLTAERWDGLRQSTSVLTLVRDGVATRQPDLISLTQGAQWGVNLANNYGVRMRGTLTAPATGNYTFFIAGDDGAEMRISSDSSRFNKRRVAWNLKYTGLREWNKFPTQRSHVVRLEGGQSYYLEALMQEAVGLDHLEIGWAYEAPGTLAPLAIGAPVIQSWSENNGKISLSVKAGDIWETSDRFGYYQRAWTGDGEISARVTAMNNPNIWAKVGVMIRASADADSAHASLVQTPGNGMSFQRRRTKGANSFQNKTLFTCEWVKIARRGDVITAFTSDDGENWVQVGNDTLPGLPQTIRIGIMASNHAPTSLAPVTANVTNFEARPFTATEQIPASLLTSITSDPADADDDGLPDIWEAAHGLNPLSSLGQHGEYGDLDNDGITNFDEYTLGSDPAVKDALANGLTYERWESLRGNRVADLTSNQSRITGYPDEISHAAQIAISGTGEDFACRYRGYLNAPVSGSYTFWIAGDDEAELWLADGSVIKSVEDQSLALTNRYGKNLLAKVQDDRFGKNYTVKGDFDTYASQRSRSICLIAGQSYYIEVLHKQGRLDSHLAAAWQVPGQPRTNIPSSVFMSNVPEDDDDDDDYLPTAWETQYGLNPADNGKIDARDGQYGDWDNDGLTNFEEYQMGTDPKNSDSDADMISDKDERDYYHSDPLVNNLIAPVLHKQIDLNYFSAGNLIWRIDDSGNFVSEKSRGWIEYSFNVSDGQAGVYEIEMLADVQGYTTGNVEMPLRFIVDGVDVGNRKLNAPIGSEKMVKLVVGYLAAGNHYLRIQVLNPRTHLFLRIKNLKINRLGGEDINADGIPDWYEGDLNGNNRLLNVSNESRVSPAFIEGKVDRFGFLGVTKAAVGGVPAQVAIERGVNSGFYCDVELSPSEPTQVTISYENDAREEVRTMNWVATNIMETPALAIRLNDSLRVAAWFGGVDPSGMFSLSKDGSPVAAADGSWNHSSSNPVVVKFDTVGQFTLQAAWSGASGEVAQGTMIVNVVSADFGEELDVLTWNRRDWALTAVPADVVIEADSALGWVEVVNPASPSRNFVVTSYEVGQNRVVARVPETGAIISQGVINAFEVIEVGRTGDSHLEEVRDDGTYVYSFSIIENGMPENAEVRFRTHFQGAVFPDGSRDLVLKNTDFDSSGTAVVRIEWPDATNHRICHTMKVYLIEP